MKTLTSIIAITLIGFTAKGSEPVPYIAMPIDKGYAIDARGKHQPNALCAHDVIWACAPRYPPCGCDQATLPPVPSKLGRLIGFFLSLGGLELLVCGNSGSRPCYGLNTASWVISGQRMTESMREF